MLAWVLVPVEFRADGLGAGLVEFLFVFRGELLQLIQGDVAEELPDGGHPLDQTLDGLLRRDLIHSLSPKKNSKISIKHDFKSPVRKEIMRFPKLF